MVRISFINVITIIILTFDYNDAVIVNYLKRNWFKKISFTEKKTDFILE